MSMFWKRPSPSDKAYAHETDESDPIKRSRAWRDLMHDRSMELVGDADTLQGSIRGQTFTGGLLARWSLSEQTLVRTAKAARLVDDEYVFVSVVLGGQGAHQRGSETTDLAAGDFAIVDATQAFTSATTTATSSRGYLHVRKSALRERLGSRHELAFGAYKADSPLQRLAFTFLRDLTGLVGHVDSATLTTLAGQSLDVIALLVNAQRPGIVEESTHRAAMLLRLKADIKANLRNPAYGLEAAAAALGVTPRYINVLLARDGRSFGRTLLDRRLEAAHRDIVDPRYVHRQVTEIAFDWGFNNASHFGKVFKERFGMTPREAKAMGALTAIRAAS